MVQKNSDDWFQWFYENWKDYCPGELIDKGLQPSQISERYIEANQLMLLEMAKDFNFDSFIALEEFMKLSESELLILKYFLRLVKLKNQSK